MLDTTVHACRNFNSAVFAAPSRENGVLRDITPPTIPMIKNLAKTAFAAVLLWTATPAALNAAPETRASDLQAVTAQIEQTMTALYLTGDEETIARSLHEQYAILLPEGERLVTYTRQAILDGIKQSKQAGKYPIFPGASFVIDEVEVTGDTAMAHVRFFQNGTHTCSDFILLYRFSGGWKWVSLTSHHHAPLQRS